MRILLPILAILLFWGLAFWSLISGIFNLADYIFNDVQATGAQIAWAVVRIVPLAEILFVIGWITGGFIFISKN
jgi:hypothetical protein